MADVPGIAFGGSPGVDRRLLPDSEGRPVARSIPITNEPYLDWSRPDGSSTWSPVHERSAITPGSMRTDTLVRRAWESLELPGEAADYHFLLQTTVGELWSRRREDPDGLSAVETFAYLDLLLLEAAPAAAMVDDNDPEQGYLQLSAIGTLCTLLKREGAFIEAEEIARRWERFGGDRERLDVTARAESLAQEPA